MPPIRDPERWPRGHHQGLGSPGLSDFQWFLSYGHIFVFPTPLVLFTLLNKANSFFFFKSNLKQKTASVIILQSEIQNELLEPQVYLSQPPPLSGVSSRLYLLPAWQTTQLDSFFFFPFFKTSLLEYNCFTLLSYLLLYNKVNQLYVHIYSHIPSLLRSPSHPPSPSSLGGHKALV